jgi:muramoyltetrapeptide carboxypeptidase
MRRPPALKAGDRLALVAPASPFDTGEFEAGVAEIRALGFDPVYDDRLFARRGYVAGEAAARAAAFEAAWSDPHVAGLIGVRGGYGSAQILPFLGRDRLMRAAKVFVGYSDLTALLTVLTCQCGLVSFHGPTVAGRLGRAESGYDRASFLRVLTEPAAAGEIGGVELESLVGGEAAGPLVGGTLTQLAASLGTPFAFVPPPGAILFLEDIAERPYRLDRLLTQLRLAGTLDRVGGILLGTFPRCDEPGGEPTVRAMFADNLRGLRGPVLFGFPSGHVDGPAVTLPFGVRTRIVAGPQSRVVIEEAAVE